MRQADLIDHGRCALDHEDPRPEFAHGVDFILGTDTVAVPAHLGYEAPDEEASLALVVEKSPCRFHPHECHLSCRCGMADGVVRPIKIYREYGSSLANSGFYVAFRAVGRKTGDPQIAVQLFWDLLWTVCGVRDVAIVVAFKAKPLADRLVVRIRSSESVGSAFALCHFRRFLAVEVGQYDWYRSR